jgi:hypothetical protein
MSTPRDRDGFDDDETGRAWQEPAHLGGDPPADDRPADDAPADEPNFADRRKQPRDEDHTAGGAAWKPPGWDLPAATPDRGRQPAVDPSWAPPATPPTTPPTTPPDAPPTTLPTTPSTTAPERSRSLFGGRRRARDPEMERAFTYGGDPLGAQAWALHRGWTVADGTGPEDAVLEELVSGAPVRPGKEARPTSVLRGRVGAVELVAFDVVEPLGRGWVPTHAITAAPMLGAVPVLRLSPARLWKHRTGGLLPLASGNDAFDSRWQLLVAEDGPQVRSLVQDPEVQGLLLGTDDGDEFWTGAGHLAAVRPDGHRPLLIEHHARLLTALVGALALGN